MIQFVKEKIVARFTNKPGRPSYFKDLLLLFSIPVGIVILAAMVVYIPQLLANPKYDFIYSLCDNYYCEDSYSINGAGLITKEVSLSIDNQYGYGDKRTLRYYDIAEGDSRSLTLEEAQTYSLDDSSKSPDGYTLVRETAGSGFLLWSNYSESWNLKNGSKKKKVELDSTSTYYQQSVELIGWVKK